MSGIYGVLKFVHVLGFVFMAIPLFNLIVVNERAMLGASFNYHADRYMENIIRRGATRCFVFQGTVLVSGLLLLLAGPLGIGALWSNPVILIKLLLLLTLTGLLSYVHLRLQPRIEATLAEARPEGPIADDLAARLRPDRLLRKRLATVCLFLVIVTIIMGLQVYGALRPLVTAGLIVAAAVFSWRANRTLLRFGWI